MHMSADPVGNGAGRILERLTRHLRLRLRFSLLVTFGSIVIAAAAAMFQRILQNAVDLKSENDLTV
jgi:hypothetical protein